MARNSELQQLVKDLGKIPPDLRKALRPALKKAASPMLADAKRRAAYSTRIPKAIRIAVTYSKKTAGVRLIVNAKRAPHARTLENLGQRGTFRHPVFGDRETWVNQDARPFLFPAVFAHAPAISKAIDATVERVATEHGFKA